MQLSKNSFLWAAVQAATRREHAKRASSSSMQSTIEIDSFFLSMARFDSEPVDPASVFSRVSTHPSQTDRLTTLVHMRSLYWTVHVPPTVIMLSGTSLFRLSERSRLRSLASSISALRLYHRRPRYVDAPVRRPWKTSVSSMWNCLTIWKGSSWNCCSIEPLSRLSTSPRHRSLSA